MPVTFRRRARYRYRAIAGPKEKPTGAGRAAQVGFRMLEHPGDPKQEIQSYQRFYFNQPTSTALIDPQNVASPPSTVAIAPALTNA